MLCPATNLPLSRPFTREKNPTPVLFLFFCFPPPPAPRRKHGGLGVLEPAINQQPTSPAIVNILTQGLSLHLLGSRTTSGNRCFLSREERSKEGNKTRGWEGLLQVEVHGLQTIPVQNAAQMEPCKGLGQAQPHPSKARQREWNTSGGLPDRNSNGGIEKLTAAFRALVRKGQHTLTRMGHQGRDSGLFPFLVLAFLSCSISQGMAGL